MKKTPVDMGTDSTHEHAVLYYKSINEQENEKDRKRYPNDGSHF